MKKILITGANSYIGDNLAKWLQNKPNEYTVDILDVKESGWQNNDFSNYHTVVNVAGIAHIKETEKNKELYYKVNRDLAYEIAQKAKNEGVKQFVFLSSMSVYGLDKGIITRNTVPFPKSNYGKSKFEAEKLISNLADEKYAVAIIRPPMVYGKGCKGNYIKLSKYALNFPVFPNIVNQRSMIYIDNLSEFIRLLVDDCMDGVFYPQNKQYVCTKEMFILIVKAHCRKVWLTKAFNSLLIWLPLETTNKVFGNLVYEKIMSEYKKNYSIVDFDESIKLSEW